MYKNACVKSLKIIKPGLLLIIPRNIPYYTKQPLFSLFFPVHTGFSGKGGVGVGVRAEGRSCKAEGIGDEEEKTSPAHQGWGVSRRAESAGLPVSTGAASEPGNYSQSVVGRALAAKHLPAGIPGETSLQHSSDLSLPLLFPRNPPSLPQQRHFQEQPLHLHKHKAHFV